MGSPPPMRGKACPATDSATPTGITPAYAGKSQARRFPVDAVQDHPRLCGEKYYAYCVMVKNVGSPPPMRGKGTVSAIPQLHRPGSPPPMRGKAIGVPLFMNSTRITPAYAGKSQFGVGSIDRIRGSPPPMRGKGYASFRFC